MLNNFLIIINAITSNDYKQSSWKVEFIFFDFTMVKSDEEKDDPFNSGTDKLP